MPGYAFHIVWSLGGHMRRIRIVIATVIGLLLAATTLVAPTSARAEVVTAGTITVKPGQRITAQFKSSETKLDKKRTVSLWASSDGGAKWTKLETVKMTAKGAVTFVRVADGDSYKAVANAFSYKSGKKKLTAVAVETAPSGAAADWASEFTSLNADQWRNRTEIGYQAKGRHCSAPVAGNTVVSGGVATLKMVEVTNAASKAEVVALAKQEQAKEAGATYTKAAAKVTSAQAGVDKANALSSATTAQKKKRDAEIKKAKKALTSAQAAVAALTPGCPSGVFTNAMITTSGKDVTDPFTIKQGTVVARVKFTPGQGAHAGIWLQDSATRQEIDIIEAYGYGRGITNIVHRLKGTALVQDPASATSGYVAVKTVASKAWWSKWHTVAVTFDSGSVTFYLDGVKTKSLSGMTGDYTLMASMLSSDWETPRVKKPVLRPGSKVKKSSLKKTSLPTMQIDWIRAWGEIS